ncbi:hypothetical protein H6G76_35270 [Nostoc sp. FACHB-152]|uniref:hypothetical protein n=1 Tax=Nostoc sp. FACHB-152 TaxID=2692837 RepID=UPI00168325BD|nr:hypothetical protein [Nostoc sp. FACHB-152]MBD2452273.1 hypothetical protein [Nostoc sp. FACHB-152]
MNTEIKLGFCNPPEPVYLYVKNGESSGESFLWYNFIVEQNKTIPVHQQALTGYLLELRITTKEFRGNDNNKLDIVIAADEVYIIRTGIDTNFAKTFLLSASLVQDFSKPLIIAVTAGEKNTVFCRLYDAATKVRIRKEWNPNSDWASLITEIQSRLTGTSASVPLTPEQPPHPQDVRVKQIRTLLNYPLDLVREYLQFQDVDRPSLLPASKIDSLVKTMCLAWAADKFENPNDAESSYQKQVIDVVASGSDELAAIKTWMQQLQGVKAGAA